MPLGGIRISGFENALTGVYEEDFMMSVQTATRKQPACGPVRGQAAVAKSNQQLHHRHLIVKALQGCGYGHYAKWPEFVRKFYSNPNERIEYAQPLSPPPFQ